MALLMNCAQLAKEIERIDKQEEALELSPLFTDEDKFIISFFYSQHKQHLKQHLKRVLQRNILEIEVVSAKII